MEKFRNILGTYHSPKKRAKPRAEVFRIRTGIIYTYEEYRVVQR